MYIFFSFPAPSEAPAVIEGRALSASTAIISWKHVANVEGYKVSLLQDFSLYLLNRKF